jgi:hypothetical protein
MFVFSVPDSNHSGERPATIHFGHRKFRLDQIEAHRNAREESTTNQRDHRGGEKGIKWIPTVSF